MLYSMIIICWSYVKYIILKIGQIKPSIEYLLSTYKIDILGTYYNLSLKLEQKRKLIRVFSIDESTIIDQLSRLPRLLLPDFQIRF